MFKILAIAAAAGFFVAASAADAQIVRRIIGHAVAGKAVKSIIGQDKDASGQDTGAEAPDPASGGRAGAADGATPPEAAPSLANPNR
jgi:hypothetical protein